ncbi:hypothetical protein MJO28_017298 [Puccinia striiformis f. sp. tritici]|nr:hypothetical protein MJO28_017298 [Puccinia striiformis f. sp. tritici]
MLKKHLAENVELWRSCYGTRTHVYNSPQTFGCLVVANPV